MANSTSHLSLISEGQASKATTANELFDAASPAMTLGRNATTSSLLSFGLYGGTITLDDGSPLQIGNRVLTLTANTTNYIELDLTDGSVDLNTSGWTGGKVRLYSIVTGASSVTSYTDWRTAGTSSGGGGPVDSVNGQTGAVVLDAGDVGADPAGTAAAAVAALIDSAPGALDTLNELAAALGDDASFASTVTTALAAKAPLASPALTGTPTAPTASGGTNTTQIATTAFVTAAVSAGGLADGDKGDITVSGSGATWTIDAGVVTTTKLGGDVTSAGKALLDDADAAAQRTTLGLGTAATAASGDFATASHTHASSGITDFAEAVDDRVAALLVQGANVTLTYDDGANTLTVAAAAPGTGTVTSVDITAPAAGITASGGPITSSGSITLALDDDLAAVEGLSATGIVRRTAADTWSAGTTVATSEIADAAVTYAKVQDVSAASKLLGRGSAGGAGDVEEITLGTGLTMSGTTLNGSSGGIAPDVQVFTADGTWTKPSGCTLVEVVCIGAGGGGGGGVGGSAGTVRAGGCGGGGGAHVRRLLRASDLGSTVSVTVGAGGNAGTAGSAGVGTAGTAGGNSSFGSHVVAYGGGLGAAGAAGSGRSGGGGGGSGGAGENGGSAATKGGLPASAVSVAGISGQGGGSPASAGNGGMAEWGGGAGGGTSSAGTGTNGAGSLYGGGGGASGGGVGSGDVAVGGGVGGDAGQYVMAQGGTAGNTSGSNGGAGAAGSSIFCGEGGGGGGSNGSGTAGNGGSGGIPGGAGGGGGGGTTVGGAGGAGARGEVRVMSW